MQRGSDNTSRWPRRLAGATSASLALHLVLFVVPLHAPAFPRPDLLIRSTVELGLEEALPGSDRPPATTGSDPTAPAPPRPALPAPRPAARPSPPLPEAPSLRLREPSLSAHTRNEATLLLPDREDAGTDAALLAALADVGADAPLLAANDDAGADAPLLAANDDAGADAAVVAAAGAIPGLLSAAPDLAPAVPQGALVTLLLRTDRLRNNPNGDRVRSLVMSIRDWQEVLEGTEIDPVRDFDSVLLASANPFGDGTHPPDLMALLRLRSSTGFLRASVEQMAGARASGPDAGTLFGHFSDRDAGALPRASRQIWQRRGTADVATLRRYRAERAFVLLGSGFAAIASPERVGPLLSVLARRPAGTVAPEGGEEAARVVALLEAHGLRNLLAPRSDPSVPIPARVEMAVFGTGPEPGTPDGGAEVRSTWTYDSEAQARRGARLIRVFLEEVGRSVDGFEGSLAGRSAALTGMVHFDRLRRALAAIMVRAEEGTVRIEARLDRDEVAELLNLQRIAGTFQ